MRSELRAGAEGVEVWRVEHKIEQLFELPRIVDAVQGGLQIRAQVAEAVGQSPHQSPAQPFRLALLFSASFGFLKKLLSKRGVLKQIEHGATLHKSPKNVPMHTDRGQQQGHGEQFGPLLSRLYLPVDGCHTSVQKLLGWSTPH